MPFSSKVKAIVIGSILLSIGINFFLVPFEVLDGGIIGIGLIFNYLWGVKAGFTIILFSIPIFFIAWFKNRHFFINSVHGMLISSFMIDLLQPFQPHVLPFNHLSPFCSSLLGGIFVGAGIGIMLRYETSTGGTDLLAQFVADKVRVNVGIIIFFIDALIVCLGGFLISSGTFLLSLLTISAVGFTTSLCTIKS